MIEIRDFGFRYRGASECAVRNACLDVPDGSFVGIIGAAASGKTTLARAIAGVVAHCYSGDFYGSVKVDGLDTVEVPLSEISRFVGYMCQDVESQMVCSVVEDEILYGLENFGVSREESFRRVAEIAEALGIEGLLRRRIVSLSGGQKQRVALAAILVLHPRVLVLDEPTAELDPAASRAVFSLLRDYAEKRGITVVAVEQKIALLSDFADTLVVMDSGRIRFAEGVDALVERVGDLSSVGIGVPRIASLMRRLRDDGVYDGPPCRTVEQACDAIGSYTFGTKGLGDMRVALCDGRGITSEKHRIAPDRWGSDRRSAVPAFEFRGVTAGYDDGSTVLHDLSLVVEPGEFVAFAGTNGAGKSTAMRLINGLLHPNEGEVFVEGKSTAVVSTSELAHTVGFLFQNPDRQICKGTVREELLFSFEALGRLDERAVSSVDAIVEEFGFDPDADPFLLGRGSRQLLALASVAVVEPRIVVLDEPTTGLDFYECERVMRFVRGLNERGTTVVMVCHDMEVVADYADRIVVMHQGAIVAEGPVFEIMRNRPILEKASIEACQMVGLSSELVRRGVVSFNGYVSKANTLDEMAHALGRLLCFRRNLEGCAGRRCDASIRSSDTPAFCRGAFPHAFRFGSCSKEMSS